MRKFLATHDQLQFPVIICLQYDPCATTTVPMPFSLPPATLPDPCCIGIDAALKVLNDLMRPLYPFLQLITCATMLINVVASIPGALGPPPNPGKPIALLNQFLSQCLPLIISYTPIGMIIELACMIAGIIKFLIQLLQCLINILTLNFSVTADALICLSSSDPALNTMGNCLTEQAAALGQALLNQTNVLLAVFNLINAIISVIPPLQQAMSNAGLFPICPGFSGSLQATLPLENLIMILQEIYSIVNLFCTGASAGVSFCPAP